MLKKISLAFLVAMGLMFTSASAQDLVQVGVLPFEIHSVKDYAYLKNEIPTVLKKHLKQQGADIADIGAAELAQFLQNRNVRAVGEKIAADFIIWGSLTWVGKQFSLDARMLETFSKAAPTLYTVEGKGIEALPKALKQLSRDISIRIFKKEKVASVSIAGNKRIETDAIIRKIKTKPGDVYLPKSLSDDLKTIYSMGYFDDIRIESEATPDGKSITFFIKEKPTIRVIRLKGNKVYDDDEIKEELDIKTGSILNIFKIQNNIKRIEELYHEKNYHHVGVSYRVEPLKNNQADLEIEIVEGAKIQIKSITFEGNKQYDNDKLKKLMKTSEKGIFSWLTSSGDLTIEDLEQDIAKLTAFYHNNGYIRAKVGDPKIEYKGNWIYITIKIEEGPRFKVGEVKVKGDLIESQEALLQKLNISREEYFSRETVRNDILELTDLYSDEGYAYVEIAPKVDPNTEKLMVDITYDIDKGKQVYFEKIIISGNTKTRDKVIRRELKVYEQELYSGKRLKRGVRNLYRLDFFEDVKIDTPKGSADDKMILNIDVTEKATGSFSIGGGYSSVENAFFTGSIMERNLFGRGFVLKFNAEIGGRTNRYVLSFTDPWLFDIPLAAGFDLYNRTKDYDTYDLDSIGGTLRGSYPVLDYTRFYLSYTYDVSDVSNLEEDAPLGAQDMEGENVMSKIVSSLIYDSRDRIFNPSEGIKTSFAVQYAGGGLGGDIGYVKYIGDFGWYIPIFWEVVGFVHAKGGYVEENSDGKLPIYDRFYLGGINSVRGFDWHDISPKDENGEPIGGDKFTQFNLELIFPLVKKAGVMGVTFFDMGNVWYEDVSADLADLQTSAGAGIRWYSPLGPIRLEYGYILEAEEGISQDGRWEFTMGQAF